MTIGDRQVELLPVEVLIVGAGPVGLSAAIELGRRGVRCLVVERNDRVGYSPRAKTTNVRTREHLRRWGIADALRQASPIAPDRPSTVVFATRMNGHFLARFENALSGSRERNNLYSEEAQWVPQYILEDVLRQRAQSFDCVTVRFETEFVSFEQTAQGRDGDDPRSPHRRHRDSREQLSDRRRRCTQRSARGDRGCDGRRRRVLEELHHHLQGARSRRPQQIRTGHHVLDGQRGRAVAARADGRARPVVLHGDQARRRSGDHRRGRSDPPRHRFARSRHRDRRHRFLGGAPAGRRPLRARPGVSCRRRLPSASAVRRLRHEYGHRRRRRSRLENGGAASRLGRRRSARLATNSNAARCTSAPSRKRSTITARWPTNWCVRRSKSPA